MRVAILNVYGEDKPETYPGIDVLNLPFKETIPDDKKWIEFKGASLKRLYYVIKFLAQQSRYMEKVRAYVQDKANAFYCGSYHLAMPTEFLNLKKPCYYWGLRAYRMAGFRQTFINNPFLAFRMLQLKKMFLKNPFQSLFVSNEIIKKEFIQIGVPEDRLVIREERCMESPTTFNPDIKEEKFSLLVIGGLRRQKHVETTIRAFKKASLNDAVLRLVGENSDKDYEKTIEEEIAGCENIERINQRLRYEDFNDYISRAHFVLFADEKGRSSITNGTMMEAIINYTPFIAPNYEPYSFYIKKYGVGFTYEPGDIDSYAKTLNKAREFDSRYFVEKIQSFQKEIAFDGVAKRLYESIKQ